MKMKIMAIKIFMQEPTLQNVILVSMYVLCKLNRNQKE